MENDPQEISAETRAIAAGVSSALLRLHKALLDDERFVYEAVHGPVESPYEMLRIAMSDPQFAWLGKVLSLVARLDEASEPRSRSSEKELQALLAETRALLNLETQDRMFIESYQKALRRSEDVRIKHENALKIAKGVD